MIRRRASSLVLVVVIMASIIVVVFGASRLTLVQYNQSNRDEDNIYALYAAKAGVEDGLARFRYNRDAETTLNSDVSTLTVQRFDLTTGISYSDQIPATEPISRVTGYTPTDQYYDLAMAFRDTQMGAFSGDTSGNKTVTKDDVFELTGFPDTGSQAYFLRYQLEFINCSDPDNSHRLVQLQQISNSLTPYDQTTVRYPVAGSIVDSAGSTGSGNILLHPAGQSLTSSIRLRPFGCDVRLALATSLSSSGDGQGTDAGPKFDSHLVDGHLTTVVTATGYYGQAKRTLVAQIDRVSGQLISILDFNVYAGNGNISP